MNGQVVIVCIASSRKARNIERNNNVTVLIDTQQPIRGILIYGKAELDYDNIYRKAVSVFETWGLPKEKVERFTQAYLDAVKCVIIRVTPERMVTFDYTKDDVYNNLVKTYL
jgi:general stress protein 26